VFAVLANADNTILHWTLGVGHRFVSRFRFPNSVFAAQHVRAPSARAAGRAEPTFRSQNRAACQDDFVQVLPLVGSSFEHRPRSPVGLGRRESKGRRFDSRAPGRRIHEGRSLRDTSATQSASPRPPIMAPPAVRCRKAVIMRTCRCRHNSVPILIRSYHPSKPPGRCREDGQGGWGRSL
jgi:hypothetical protein